MSDTATNPTSMSFDEWLDVIEQYRDLGLPIPNPREKEKWTAEEVAWMQLVNGDESNGIVGLKAKWKETAKAFEAFKNDEQLWDGVNAPVKQEEIDPKKPKTLYGKIMMGLNFTANIMTPPFSSAFMQWAMESDYLPHVLHDIAHVPNDEVNYDKFRADMLEAFGRDLMKKGNSRIFEGGTLNNTYVAQNSNGEWVTLDENRVAELLRLGAEGKGPHVVITANHAFFEAMNDLTPITEGYTKLIHEVTNGKANLVPYDGDSQSFNTDQTILIAATNTRENNFLNLAQLFHRLYEVEKCNGHPELDKFEHTSPIAKMMVSTILKAIAEDSSQIEVDSSQSPPRFNKAEHVRLRPEATEIMRRAIYFGFSKGGNDFRDGMRLLARTLDGQSPDGSPTYIATKGTIKDIISTISVTVQSLNEKPLADYYKDRGVTVTYFTNRHDTIALTPDIEHDDQDAAMAYVGSTKSNGHHPGVITENLSHPYILQHHRCVLAGVEGKPAIRFVLHEKIVDEETGQLRHALVLKTAPGTSNAMMEKAIPTIEKAFFDHDISHLKIRPIPGERGVKRYEIYSPYGIDDVLCDKTIGLRPHGTKKGLLPAFESLRLDPDNGILVSSALTDPNLPCLATSVRQAKLGFDPDNPVNAGKDWKDNIRDIGKKMYDDRMRQINKFMGDIPLHLPIDAVISRAPQMDDSKGQRRV